LFDLDQLEHKLAISSDTRECWANFSTLVTLETNRNEEIGARMVNVKAMTAIGTNQKDYEKQLHSSTGYT